MAPQIKPPIGVHLVLRLDQRPVLDPDATTDQLLLKLHSSSIISVIELESYCEAFNMRLQGASSEEKRRLTLNALSISLITACFQGRSNVVNALLHRCGLTPASVIGEAIVYAIRRDIGVPLLQKLFQIALDRNVGVYITDVGAAFRAARARGPEKKQVYDALVEFCTNRPRSYYPAVNQISAGEKGAVAPDLEKFRHIEFLVIHQRFAHLNYCHLEFLFNALSQAALDPEHRIYNAMLLILTNHNRHLLENLIPPNEEEPPLRLYLLEPDLASAVRNNNLREARHFCQTLMIRYQNNQIAYPELIKQLSNALKEAVQLEKPEAIALIKKETTPDLIAQAMRTILPYLLQHTDCSLSAIDLALSESKKYSEFNWIVSLFVALSKNKKRSFSLKNQIWQRLHRYWNQPELKPVLGFPPVESPSKSHLATQYSKRTCEHFDSAVQSIPLDGRPVYIGNALIEATCPSKVDILLLEHALRAANQYGVDMVRFQSAYYNLQLIEDYELSNTCVALVSNFWIGAKRIQPAPLTS